MSIICTKLLTKQNQEEKLRLFAKLFTNKTSKSFDGLTVVVKPQN